MYDDDMNGTQTPQDKPESDMTNEVSESGMTNEDIREEAVIQETYANEEAREAGHTDNVQENSTDHAPENHEYRYGRSYYQNQQDSVYHTNENVYHTGNNTQQSGESANQTSYSQSQYQTYTTGNYSQNNSYTQQMNTPNSSSSNEKSHKKSSGKKTGMKILKVAACGVLVVALGAGSAFATVKLMDKDDKEVKTVQSTNVGSNTDKTANYTVSTVSASTAVVTDVSDVVEKTMPSVVKITNVGTQTYESFWGQGGTYEYESNGSGIIIGQTEEELLVVTNQHVVSGADKLKVIFIDEESCEANVKGTDAEKDLAVIAIPLESIKDETLEQIKVATLGDSDNLKVGEPAIAIGNALGYGQSVTLGVISAKDREVTTENGTNTLIQTDAAINPGNSGGALLNIAGEVIGINSVKYSSTEVEGMGYAIPITDATPIINELMNKETKTKVDEDQQSYLGINGVDITSDVAQTYNMPKGVYIAQVVEDSPADKADLKKGDIITKIAGVSVTSFDELKAELEYHAAGTTVEVEILTQARGSYGYETKTVEVTLAKKED